MRSNVGLLLIDDNPRSLELMSTALRADGVDIHTASDPEQGLDLARTRRPQIVITDLVMPKLSGMEVLERLVESDPAIDVILMTAHYSTESAVEAIRKGACDYWNKPVDLSSARKRVNELVAVARRRIEAQSIEGDLDRAAFHGIIGNSPRMWDVFSRIRRVAPHYRTVLVTGPTGTGKDLVARALHDLSPASQGHFVVLNCSAVVETLFESELFGHMRGSFTGAQADKPGLFEHAHHGTLFLDEIGDMPLATQAKLLRAIQNQEIQRLGSLVPKKVDVRIVAATNRDLRAGIANKTFREDLFYRLSMVEVALPPLAERDGDLGLLIRHFLRKFSTLYGKPARGLTRRAEILLERHLWPGNVRELENVIGHASMMSIGEMIDVSDLPPYLFAGPAAATTAAPAAPGALPALEDQERALLIQALEKSHGNQSQAARLLRISRDTLRYRLKKHGLG